MALFFAGLGLIIAGAIVATILREWDGADTLLQVLVVTGCVLSGVTAVSVLVQGTHPQYVLQASVPGGDWVFGIDALSAVFLLVILGVGATTLRFGVVYLAAYRGRRPIWFSHAAYAVLLVALALVVVARSVVPFLSAWEIMAVGSYFLIVFEDDKAEVRRAGLVYLVATHFGTLALFAMFATWALGAHAADWSFASLAVVAPRLAGGGFVLTLAVIGFGVKAGLVPLHFWLPPAHAASPTHVSAILSGVVIKAGIYGLLRVLTMLGGGPAWWGWGLLLVGAASGVLGVLWALAQHDLKRLLAYHSVENIGIILMGTAVGALGTHYGHPVVATIGYAGAVLHTINHALFKSVLFLAGGSVYRATETRELEQLGGLARALPYTTVAFVIGAVAIIGLPPLNGFVSEWLVYQALLRASQSADVLRLAVLGVPALALIGALALACFAKVIGVVFLGRPRSARARGVTEMPLRPLLAPMYVLAGLCVLLGVAVPLGVAPSLRAGAIAAHATAAHLGDARALLVDARVIGTLAAAMLALILVVWVGRWLLQARAPRRTGATWSCGYTGVTSRMQYTASSFAAPLLTAFGRLSGVQTRRSPTSFATHPYDLVLDRLAAPVWARVRRAALRLRPLQQGRLYAYLIYVMAALLTLLGYLALASRP